jgi:predicted nucleic acid-binding protein
MDAYFDSAIIIKLYVQESNSAHAISLVSAYPSAAPLTRWQILEVKNAIRLKVFRKEISTGEMTQSIAAFDQDIAAKRWVRPDYSVATVEQKGRRTIGKPRRYPRLPHARYYPSTLQLHWSLARKIS